MALYVILHTIYFRRHFFVTRNDYLRRPLVTVVEMCVLASRDTAGFGVLCRQAICCQTMIQHCSRDLLFCVTHHFLLLICLWQRPPLKVCQLLSLTYTVVYCHIGIPFNASYLW